MKINSELAKGSIKNSKRSSAVFYSILIAVVMLGTLLFIYSELELGQWKYHQEMFGDYHATLFNISKDEYKQLHENRDIETLEFSKGIFIENTPFKRPNLNLYLQTPLLLNSGFGFFESRLLEGDLPHENNEILVSEAFLLENPSYTLGEKIKLGTNEYQICGVFREDLMSFDKSYLFFGKLTMEDTSKLFQDTNISIDATIWFKNERDTYTSMRHILKDFERGSEDELLKKGGLDYNTEYLEGKLIFKSGLIPSREFIERWSLRVGLLVSMLALFVLIIYNSFNVWNNQELRQVALLKSTGMTPRQIRYLVLEKALRLSLKPILWGLILAYGCTNLLFFLMWLNGEKALMSGQTYQFKLVTPNPLVFIVLFALALFCVFLAALKPARQSSKLSIVESMKGIQTYKSKMRLRFTKDSQNVICSLAKDNAVSYRHTFRGLALAMALAGLIFSTVLIVQAQRNLEDKFNTPESPYTLTSSIFTIQKIPKNLLADLKTIPNIKDIHTFSTYDFQYLQAENKVFVSDQLKASLEVNTTKRDYKPKVTVFGLEDTDFQAILLEYGLNEFETEGFLLLDKIAQNPHKAYKQRTYIPLSKETSTTIAVQDSIDKKRYDLPIIGRINTFPFELKPLWPDQIALFTSMTKLEEFRFTNNKVDENHPITYNIKAATDLEILPQVTEEVNKTIYKYFPKTDTWTRNLLGDSASKEEQYRNELLLTLGAQILFVIIGFSNAFNSFHINLQTRTRDFAMLRSVGMTEEQIKKMLHYEIWFLIRKVILYYVFLLAAGIFALTAKKKFMFSPWQLASNLNFPLLLFFFLISILGIWLAMESGKRKVLKQTIITALRQEY